MRHRHADLLPPAAAGDEPVAHTPTQAQDMAAVVEFANLLEEICAAREAEAASEVATWRACTRMWRYIQDARAEGIQ